MQTSAAVVTQISEVAHIHWIEINTAGHCRENSTKPFAISTGITDSQHPRCLYLRNW
jgi:hypothetical protein